MIERRTRSFLLLAAILPGWGDHFDTPRIIAANHSVAGRSSRTYINERRCATVLAQLKKELTFCSR